MDRTLNARGKADAPKMGRRLQTTGFAPDLVLSSPAKRARRTAKAIMRELEKPPSFGIEPSLYMADPEEIFGLIRSLGGSLGHVAIVGHNPGITELANLLGAAGIDNVPTSGVVRFELHIDAWADARPGCGRLLEFDYPKKAGRSADE